MTETELIDKYICQHIEPEGDYLYRLYRATNIHTIHGRMASGHIQGRLLKMLVQMIRPKNILEVGTFSGYSAICLAQGLQEGGKLYTFEINDEMEDFTRPWIEGSDVADKIDFRIGDANEEAPKLGVMFDLAFVDGDKRTYIETYEMVMKILNPGGYILADNTLWDGHVIDPAYDRDHQTKGIRAFNDLIANDPRVEVVILPLRDGLLLQCGSTLPNAARGCICSAGTERFTHLGIQAPLLSRKPRGVHTGAGQLGARADPRLALAVVAQARGLQDAGQQRGGHGGQVGLGLDHRVRRRRHAAGGGGAARKVRLLADAVLRDGHAIGRR